MGFSRQEYWMQPQKQQNDLYSFPKQMIQLISNPTASTDAEEAEFEWFYEDLQHCLELIPKR